MLEAIFDNSDRHFSTDLRLVLFRVLIIAYPVEANRSVVSVLEHKRLVNAKSYGGHINDVLLDYRDWIRPFMIVIDPYWMKSKYGLSALFKDIADDHTTQAQIRFFHICCFSIFKRKQTIGQKS